MERKINELASTPTETQILSLGDHLKKFFIQQILQLNVAKVMFRVEELIGKHLFVGI